MDLKGPTIFIYYVKQSSVVANVGNKEQVYTNKDAPKGRDENYRERFARFDLVVCCRLFAGTVSNQYLGILSQFHLISTNKKNA